jgi:hypothetical protein
MQVKCSRSGKLPPLGPGYDAKLVGPPGIPGDLPLIRRQFGQPVEPAGQNAARTMSVPPCLAPPPLTNPPQPKINPTDRSATTGARLFGCKT